MQGLAPGLGSFLVVAAFLGRTAEPLDQLALRSAGQFEACQALAERRRFGQALGVQLLVDIGIDTDGHDMGHIAGSGAETQAIDDMQRLVLAGERCRLRHRPNQAEQTHPEATRHQQ